MRPAPLFFALLLAPFAASAQPSTDRLTLCGHPVRVEAGNVLTGLRGGPITLAPGTVTLDPYTLTRGFAVVARVAREGSPVESAVAVCVDASLPALAWRGPTAWRGEDVGDRTRDLVAPSPAQGGRVELVVRHLRESPRLCGFDAWTAETSRIDAVTASVAPAVDADPLDASAAAVIVPATAAPTRPRGFTPRNVAVTTGDARALFDHDARTAWSPQRHGFATVTLPSGAFVLRGIDLSPSTTPTPRRWSLVVARPQSAEARPVVERFDFEVPPTPPAGDQVWRVTLPTAAPARCVSLVARGAAPTESLGDVAIRSALDDGAEALSSLARAVDGADGDAAASMLVELGPSGAAALASALPNLSTVGARRAIRALSTVPRADTANALVAALDREETAEAASDALRRGGARARDALSGVAATNPRAVRVIAEIAAPLDARLRAALPVLSAEREVWTAARPSLASLVAGCAAAHAGAAWIAMIPEAPLAASRALRVTAETFAREDPTRALAATRALALWNAVDDFETRYRLLAALAGDAEGRRVLASVLGGDPDHDLRAAAALALAGDAGSVEALRTATNDRVPRVRAAAIESLRGRHEATESLLRSLTNDPWPSVRAAAASALAAEPSAAPALLGALDAGSSVTVRAAIEALSQNPGEGITPRLAAFLEGSRRSPELRREAAEALGRRCDRAAAPTLERVAEELSDPALPPWEQAVGHAALASLARLDGARARAFLTRSEANSEAAAAVARAARAACR
ncbi:MAG: HEAT repeat domain-containing protein [Polyangiales bacterium]